MKNLILIGLLSVGLVACGGGGGGSSSNSNTGSTGGNTSTEDIVLDGFFTGTTSNSQEIGILVTPKNSGVNTQEYWALYSLQGNNNLVGGFIHGSMDISGNKVTSTNSKDFFISGGSAFDTTVSATAKSKDSLNGSVKYPTSSVVDFNTSYSSTLNKEVNLSSIVGKITGQVGILQGTETATITIKQSGQSGTAAAEAGTFYGSGSSGCGFTGALQRATAKTYFTFYIKFNGSPCYLANQTLSGVITYDSSKGIVRAAAVDSDRTNGVLFVGNK